MVGYLARRLGQSLVVLLGITIVVFALIHLVPGDPVRVGLGIRFDPETYAALRHRAGLDQPLVTQYFSYLRNAATGDLGVSFFTGEPVTQILLERLPATLSLALTGFIFGLLIAFPLGSLAAMRHNTWIDSGLRLVSQIGISVPDFWIGIVLIVVLAGAVRWLPPSGYVPWPLLGLPPTWYKSAPYRSRAVREPRTVLSEFGLQLPDDVAVNVWDSTSDVRYLVLPERADGTEGWTEEELAGIVTRDCMIGVARPQIPLELKRG